MSFTFSRNSKAYDVNGVEKGINVPITKTLARRGAAWAVRRPINEGANEPVFVFAGTSGRLFGRDATFAKIYVNDGAGWIDTTRRGNLANGYCTSDGTLFYCTGEK